MCQDKKSRMSYVRVAAITNDVENQASGDMKQAQKDKNEGHRSKETSKNNMK